MKIVIAASLLFAFGAAIATFGVGSGEGVAATYDLVVVTSGSYSWQEAPGLHDTLGYETPQDLIIGEFEKRHPGVSVTYVIRDVTQGSMTVDALMAKGTPPDVWMDATGYFRDYLNPEYSLPLEQYMDVGVFVDELVAPTTVDGHVYAIPINNIGTGMAINTDMLDKIGYTLPEQSDWTIDEYMRLARLLKEAGHYVTAVFTQEGFSAWLYPWIYAFGGTLYADGDYSKVAINTPESRQALEFMKMLVDEGYAVPHPNEVDDDISIDLFSTGKIFSMMAQNGHFQYWVPEQVKQGVMEKEVGYTFIEWPHVPEVVHTPVYGYQTVINVHRTDDERKNELAAELAGDFLSSRFMDYTTTLSGGFPMIVDYEIPNEGRAAHPAFRAVAEVLASTTLMDLGGLHPRAREVRDAANVPIQVFMDGEITAQQFLDRFEAEANAILKQ